MKISFLWDNNKITPEQKERVEKNISNEISRHKDMLQQSTDEILVSLFTAPHQMSLDGVATDNADNMLVKITYSLLHGSTADYEYLGDSHNQ